MEALELIKLRLTYAGMAELPPDEIITAEIKAAETFINHRRNHIPTFELTVPSEYDSMRIKLALSALLKIGAEGQTGHSENGIARSYMTDGDYPRDLLRQIPWAVR